MMIVLILALCAAFFTLGMGLGHAMAVRPTNGFVPETLDDYRQQSMSRSSELSKPQTPTELNQGRE